jgi:hypothetical protein
MADDRFADAGRSGEAPDLRTGRKCVVEIDRRPADARSRTVAVLAARFSGRAIQSTPGD